MYHYFTGSWLADRRDANGVESVSASDKLTEFGCIGHGWRWSSAGHGLNSCWDSDFVFAPLLRHVDQFTFHISLPGAKFTIFINLSMWNVFIQLRMHQSLNDLQRVIQDSAHFLLTSDKSHHTSPDPVLHPLKFVCALNLTEYDSYRALLNTDYNLRKFIRAVFKWVL